jgi:hypothetical protein
VFDLKDGFHHLPLTQAGKDKCYFSTEYGVYQFNVLPFGVANVAEDFQNEAEKIFGDTEGVTVFIDDLMVSVNTESEHGEIVAKVMQRAQENDVKFKESKIQYKQKEVKYVGHIFNEQGMYSDPDRVKALCELRSPKPRKNYREWACLSICVVSFLTLQPYQLLFMNC